MIISKIRIGKFALFGVFAFVLLASVQLVRAYTVSDFSASVSTVAYSAGATNVFLGQFTGPVPATDTLILNGAGNTVAAESALSAFASTERMVDVNGSGEFESTDPLVRSANTTLDTSDTVLATVANALTAFGSTEVAGTNLVADQDSDGVHDNNEPIIRLLVNGGDGTLDSAFDAEFPLADAPDEPSNFFFSYGDGAYDFTIVDPPAILEYTYDTVEMGSVITVITEGDVGFTTFDSGDAICLDDVDVDGMFDPSGDRLWWDAAGSCTTFNSGVDIIINNDGVGGNPEGGVKMSTISPPDVLGPITLGYSDGDADGVYDCARGDVCEAVIFIAGSYAYPTGTNVEPGGFFGAMYGAKTDVTNDVYQVAIYPTEIDNEGTNVHYMDKEVDAFGNGIYRFADYNANGDYDDGEDVYQLLAYAEVSSPGDFEYFTSSYRYLDTTDAGEFTTDHPIFVSANADLDQGALDGSGTDTLNQQVSNIFTAIPADTKYFDHNVSGSYEVGDDIVLDEDGSDYYNADQMQGLELTNTPVDYPAGNDDIDTLYIYQRVGGSCAGSGSDTLVHTEGSSPFLDTTLAVEDVFSAAVTYCVYADLRENATGGEYFKLAIPQNGITYSSGAGPTDAALNLGSGFVSVIQTLAATITPDATVAGADAAYTTAFTLGYGLVSGDQISVLFPSGYDVSGASVACTDDGASITGTSGVSSQHVRLTLGATVTSGSAIECVVSSVANPTDAGEYDAFGVFVYRDADVGTI